MGANTQLAPSDLATSAPSEVGRSHSMTLAPWRRNRSAVARPSPDADPVTKLTIPYSKEEKQRVSGTQEEEESLRQLELELILMHQ